MKRAAVLGARGFIGSNICAELLRRGWEVRGLVGAAPAPALKDLDVQVHQGAIDDPDVLRQIMTGADVVFHAAGSNPRRSIGRTRELRRAERQIHTVIAAFAASGAERLVYTGASCVLWPHEAKVRSTLAQVKSILADEVQGAVSLGVDVVTLIPTHCMGERDARAGSGALILALAERRMPALTDGHICPVDIQAVARAHVELALTGAKGETRLVRGPDMTVGDLVRLAAKELGVTPPTRTAAAKSLYPLAHALEWLSVVAPFRPPLTIETLDLVVHSAPVDGEQVSSESDIRAAVRRAAQWYAENGYLHSSPNAPGGRAA